MKVRESREKLVYSQFTDIRSFRRIFLKKKCKILIVCKSDIIIVWLITSNFIMQGITLTEHLDASQKADMRAYMSLVSNVLGNAEVFILYQN